MPQRMRLVGFLLFYVVSQGCATHPPDRSASPLTVVVGPVSFEAPVTKSAQLDTFDQDRDRETDRQLLRILIDEIEVRAQHQFAERGDLVWRAEIFGWAFRPVRVHLDAIQVESCSGLIWSRDELVLKVPGKRLEQYPEDRQHLKQVQLEANLDEAVDKLAAEAVEVLKLQPCSDDNKAAPLRSFSWASIFDLLL
ncbi:MAG TPA: hypothetical protein VJ746_00925 [Nitrospira sp.]|nr:hypothetical protein [Nitrospira sp.]